MNLGIDFSSGTRVEILAQEPLNQETFAEQIEELGNPSDDILISGEERDIGVIRYKDEFTQEEVNKFKADIA